MIGKTLSVVTLDSVTHNKATLDNGTALSGNYLKVALAKSREANRIEEIRIGGLTSDGICEIGTLPVFA